MNDDNPYRAAGMPPALGPMLRPQHMSDALAAQGAGASLLHQGGVQNPQRPVSNDPHMLVDWEIEVLAMEGMISPFEARSTSKDGAVSHGLTPCGYDIRLGETLMIARPGVCWRPGFQKSEDFEVVTLKAGEPFVLPAGRLVLGHTIERFRLPANIVGQCKGKSSWARCGLQMGDPPCEPGWGLRSRVAPQLTLELFPTVNVSVFLGDGIAQMQFTRIQPPRRDYSVVGGKYNDQDGVVLSRRA